MTCFSVFINKCAGILQVFKTSCVLQYVVRRSLSKNPNMLRTMVGTGLMLILILSYAVYSNTVDSEYYGYETTNTNEILELQLEENGSADWYATTKSAITWINVSIENAPLEDLTVVIESQGIESEWYYSPNLGIKDADNFVCNEPQSDYSGLLDTCEYSSKHSILMENGSLLIKGRVSLNLPIQGKGYIESENIENAENFIKSVIRDENKTRTWTISILRDGEIISSEGIEINAEITTHDFVSIEQFKLNPIQETAYSFASLAGCFFLVLVIPLMIYYSSIYREKRNEEIRLSAKK